MRGKRFHIVGGGIVGLATAYQLLKALPHASVTVLEKEGSVGQHQTGNNSGVLHAGLYYKPGSAKALLAVNGLKEMVSFCRENQVPHEICGKLVVATDGAERHRLQALFDRGQRNGLQGLKMLDRAGMLDVEPHVAGIAAIRVPEEGIVDYPKVCEALVRHIESMGGTIVTSAKVTKVESRDGRGQQSNLPAYHPGVDVERAVPPHPGPLPQGEGEGSRSKKLKTSAWLIRTNRGDFESDFLFNCAGLQCDRVLESAGEPREMRIVPFRGEYYKLKPDRHYLVRHLIYPVPDPEFPFLGVHFTRLVHGGIEAGPNAVLAFAREGYRKTDLNPIDLFDALSFSGLWRFMGAHKRMSWEELKRSLSKRLFCEALQKLVPEIREGDLDPGGAGVRAQAMSPDGTLVQDFAIVTRPRALHVLNAPSPAATASLAIGRELVRQAIELL